MIFVTVGTHEQPFDRLVRYMDEQKEKGAFKEDVIIQTGYSTYEPKYCEWYRMLPYQDMVGMVEAARIVITHGGPSSFIMPLQMGKIPIVVPRRQQFGEHVNDHQVYFTREVVNWMGSIIAVEDIEKLEDIIKNYDEIARNMNSGNTSNNVNFNFEFEKIVSAMFDGNKRK